MGGNEDGLEGLPYLEQYFGWGWKAWTSGDLYQRATMHQRCALELAEETAFCTNPHAVRYKVYYSRLYSHHSFDKISFFELMVLWFKFFQSLDFLNFVE